MDLKSASYSELVKLCKDNGIEFKNQKKDVLIELLSSKKTKRKIKKEKKLTKTKSDLMRELYDKGTTSPAEIAKLVDSHYSFVYGVIKRYKGE